MRRALALAGILVVAGLLGRDWLGITDLPVAELRARYGQDARYVEVMGAQVRVRESGTGEPLLALHGFATSAETWDGWRPVLDGRYRMIAVDVPPFGITGPLPGRAMNTETLRAFMDELVPALGLTRFHLAGSSLGGYLAWNYARRHPDRVQKLVLIDSVGYPQYLPLAVQMMRAPLLGDMANYFAPRPIVAANVREVYGDPERVTEATIQRCQDMRRREDARPAVTQLLRSAFAFDTDGVKEVRVPTLILWGAKDRWIPPAHAASFHRDISGSQVIMYDDLGHIPMEESPARTGTDVARFLGS
jgi:pimeloyl-ACP methyl ester carboxylesterase